MRTAQLLDGNSRTAIIYRIQDGVRAMIRKLKSGEYRLYSRKKNPGPESAATWVLFHHWPKPKSMSAPYSSLSGTKEKKWQPQDRKRPGATISKRLPLLRNGNGQLHVFPNPHGRHWANRAPKWRSRKIANAPPELDLKGAGTA